MINVMYQEMERHVLTAWQECKLTPDPNPNASKYPMTSGE